MDEELMVRRVEQPVGEPHLERTVERAQGCEEHSEQQSEAFGA